MKKYY